MEISTLRIGLTLILLFAAHTCSSAVVRPQSSDLVGRWRVDVTFENESPRLFRFDAKDSGTGSLLLEGPKSNWDEPAKPSEAKWMAGPDKRVTFLGPVEFPIGNVGRQPGILVFKGTFESEKIINGDLSFFPEGEDPFDPKASPAKTGKFKASRVSVPK